MPGTKSFDELKNSIGRVTKKVLTEKLRQTEEIGLLTRKVYAEVPTWGEYTLRNWGIA
ncbi:MAG: winged helix-turn-helix transcriptional regulator [Bariatricus sp.]|nr:winged helix-turn-helix transcriptional regulator [Bariatricus sp.]